MYVVPGHGFTFGVTELYALIYVVTLRSLRGESADGKLEIGGVFFLFQLEKSAKLFPTCILEQVENKIKIASAFAGSFTRRTKRSYKCCVWQKI